MNGFTLVVAGAAGLAAHLRASGRFAEVFDVAATSGLKELIATGRLGSGPAAQASTAFVFADTTPCDTPNVPLELLVQKLTTTGWRVLIVAATPAGAALASSNPASGMITPPLSVNQVLAALAALGMRTEPVESGFEPVDLYDTSTVIVAPAHRPPAAAGDGWIVPSAGTAPQPATSAAATAPGWGQPTTTPDWGQPATQPAGGNGGWGQPAPATTPDWGQPAPAPATAPGWGQPATAPGNGMPATTPDWGQPAPATATAPGWGPPATAPGNGMPAIGGGMSPAGWGQPAAGAHTAMPGLGGGQMPGLGGGGFGGGMPNMRVGTYGADHAPATARRGHVIVVTAPKGGTGKSTLSLNLTCYLGLRLRPLNRSVCIIDTNFQQADTGKYLNVYSPNITHILKDQTSLTRDRILSQMVHRPDLGFSALLGPAMGKDANPQWINAKLYNQILPLLQEHFDYIIVDTPVAELFHDIHSDFALPNADYIIVPITPNVATLMNADRWLHEICQPVHVSGGAGADRNKIGVVLNRHKDTVGLSFDDVQTELAQWNLIGVIPETDEWQRANNENVLVATRNYRELNDAFSRVLYAATGEEELLRSITAVVPEKSGLKDRLFGRRKGR